MNQTNQTDEIASSRGEVGNMPQDMVLGACPTVTLSTAANGNVGQAPNTYNPK